MNHPDLLILCATLPEVSGFLALCPEKSTCTTKTGHQIRSGKVGSSSYDLLITGPGVFNMAYAFAACLNESAPETVIVTGIAGVFRQSGFGIGDIGIATQEQYLHTGIQGQGIKNDPLPFELIGNYPLTRQGIYLFDEEKADAYQKKISLNADAYLADESRTKIFKGPFLTVSTITSSTEDADLLYCAYGGVVMESMEGAACAHIAACCDLPLVQIRSASNFVGQRDKTRWDIETAVNRLGKALASI
ncbi:MAG: futalosine hydrolase [Proteobacteria bacterium]|nr:futalosine hydrolase [Pseudomonadota bacterium]MBU1386455.1 futalosine hydrolase [Pseudomonadota bacterium]MBU1544566.1 futalosine hydrolase [Pseudomonadota bacterium]MBU2431792.1 futalosine hydrolase [Pseudomonadota bacterium]MBU2481223.1 futalosine hydrolase [Pseudomonadota bacterium]